MKGRSRINRGRVSVLKGNEGQASKSAPPSLNPIQRRSDRRNSLISRKHAVPRADLRRGREGGNASTSHRR